MVELLIAEKPSAAEKIAFALADNKPVKKSNNRVPYYEIIHNGKKLIVCAAVGHLYNLAEKTKKWTYPAYDIEWKDSPSVRKDASYVKDYIVTLTKLAKEADEFTICTDFDIEGELIGWNALRFACGQKDGHRMKFSTLTKGDLREAYEKKTKHIDWGQAHAGETRHKMDWFYGINLSRALTASIKAAKSFKIMSIGRVQGPALKLIVDREREITAFKPQPFWQIQLLGHAKSKDIEAWHVEDKFWDKDKADKVFIKVKHEKTATVMNLRRNEVKQPAPYPFDLTTLQTESFGHMGISPKETLAHAQKLYLAGVISYPRTSSQQLDPKLGFHSILNQLKKMPKYEQLAEKILQIKDLKPNNGKKTDPAHPAIYPTGNVPKTLTEREAKVYDLIVKRFLATFGPDATIETLALTMDVKKEEFKANGKRTIVPGWHIFYMPYIKQKEIELPAVKENDEVNIKELNLLSKETQPPKRYTQSSIIKELEKRNLGTKATRAEIVDTLFKRGYADGKQVAATELGIHTIKTLEKYSPKILDETLTRKFEEDMEEIREGKEKPDEVLEDAKKVLTEILEDFKKHEKNIGEELLQAVRDERDAASILGKCHKCKNGTLKIIMSKKSKKKFVACDQYPKCEITFNLPQNALIKPNETPCATCAYPQILIIRARARPQVTCINPTCSSKKLDKIEQKEVDQIEAGKVKKMCKLCKSPMVVRKSFYGMFLGCSTYPKCRSTEKLDKEEKDGAKKDSKTTTKPATPKAKVSKPRAKKIK